jgi:hypothetical protein
MICSSTTRGSSISCLHQPVHVAIIG